MAIFYPTTDILPLRRLCKVLTTQATPSGLYRAKLSFTVDGAPFLVNGIPVTIYAAPSVGSSFDTFTFDLEREVEAALAAKRRAAGAASSSFFSAPIFQNVNTNTVLLEVNIEYFELDDSNGYNEIVSSSTSDDTDSFTVVNMNTGRRLDFAVSDVVADNAGKWSAGTVPLLTDAPRTQPIAIEQAAFIQALNGDTNKFTHIRVSTYDSTGANAFTDYISMGSPADYTYSLASVSPKQLDAATWIVGHAPLLVVKAAYYTVDFGVYSGGAYTKRSEQMRFNVQPNCNDGLRVIFQNRYGGWDSYTFNLTKFYNAETSWEDFTESDNGGFYNAIYNRERRYNLEQGFTYEARSGGITEAERLWLEQMLLSPEIFIEAYDSDGIAYPVPVSIVNADQKQVGNDFLLYEFNVTLQEANKEVSTAQW